MGRTEKVDETSPRQVQAKKYKRSSSYVPSEIEFDTSDLGSVESEEIDLPKELRPTKKRKKKKTRKKKRQSQQKSWDDIDSPNSLAKSSQLKVANARLRRDFRNPFDCSSQSEADKTITDAEPGESQSPRRGKKPIKTKTSTDSKQTLTEANKTLQIPSLFESQQKAAVEGGPPAPKTDSAKPPSTLPVGSSSNNDSVFQTSSTERLNSKQPSIKLHESKAEAGTNFSVAPKYASALQKYKTNQKSEEKQPSKNAIIKLIDNRFHEMDMKQNTIADVYKLVEDYFVVKLNDTNRKAIRRRLVDLCSEQAMEQQQQQKKQKRIPTGQEQQSSPSIRPDDDSITQINISKDDKATVVESTMGSESNLKKPVSKSNVESSLEEEEYQVETKMERDIDGNFMNRRQTADMEEVIDEEEVVAAKKVIDVGKNCEPPDMVEGIIVFDEGLLEENEISKEAFGEETTRSDENSVTNIAEEPKTINPEHDGVYKSNDDGDAYMTEKLDSFSNGSTFSHHNGRGEQEILSKFPNKSEDFDNNVKTWCAPENGAEKSLTSSDRDVASGNCSTSGDFEDDTDTWSGHMEHRHAYGARRRKRPDPAAMSGSDDNLVSAMESGECTGNSSSRFSRQGGLLCFRNLGFEIGRGEKRRKILQNISGHVRGGSVLAVVGSTGAGKTSLLRSLALDTSHGYPSGEAMLNGIELTSKVFRHHGYIMKHDDRVWPSLTCREVMMYAARLFTKSHNEGIVDEVGRNLGLGMFMETRVAKLNRVHHRFLLMAVAFLKHPALLLLDEPTFGLDIASASKMMTELQREAVRQSMIVVFTTHAPSSTIRRRFDQIMLLAKGEPAFFGESGFLVDHFAAVGYPCPFAWTPPDYYLALLCPGVSNAKTIDTLLEAWRIPGSSELDARIMENPEQHQDGKFEMAFHKNSKLRVLWSLIRRHSRISASDRALYIVRGSIIALVNIAIALVYWNVRTISQEEALNLLWMLVWYQFLPCTAVGAFGVILLNKEFKVVQNETRNGMYHPLMYGVTKTLLAIPMTLFISFFSIGLPGYFVHQFSGESFGTVFGLFTASLYAWEAIAECYAVWFFNPTIGCIMFAITSSLALLCAGIFLPSGDLFWPFRVVNYFLPLMPYIRSSMYAVLAEEDAVPCVDPVDSLVCANSTLGSDVLELVGRVVPLISSENHIPVDIAKLLWVSTFFRLVYMLRVGFLAAPTRTLAN